MPDSDKLLQKKDVYSVDYVLKIRGNIRDTVRKCSDTKKYMDLEFNDAVWGESSTEVIDALVPVFAGALNVGRDVVFQSLHALLRKEHITVSDVDTVAWIMAGNFRKLLSGVPVEPFVNVTYDEWVPVMVTDYDRCWRYERRGGNYTFKVMGGSPTTHKLVRFFADDKQAKSHSFLKRVFGLPRFDKVNSEEFVGMYIWVLLDPIKSQQAGKPCFEHLECNPTFAAHNRKLNKQRKEPCLLYPDWAMWDCCNCANGLTTCQRATHSAEYVVMHCEHCGKESVHEQGSDGRMCIRCREARRMAIGKDRSQ